MVAMGCILAAAVAIYTVGSAGDDSKITNIHKELIEVLSVGLRVLEEMIELLHGITKH